MAEILKDTTNNTIGTGSGGLQLDPSGTEVVTINNGVLIPDGTVTEPAIRFTDDSNTGIFSPAQEQVAITGNGSTVALFDGTAGTMTLSGLTYPGTDGTNGQVLTTDGAGNLSFAAAGGGSSALNDLTDTVITTPSTDQVLTYNGTNWVNQENSVSGLSANLTFEPTVTGTNSVSIGNQASVSGNDAVAIGSSPAASGNQSVAIGTNPIASALSAIAIGVYTQATTDNAVTVGAGSVATNWNTISLGTTSTASGSGAVAIGQNANAAGNNSMALGFNSGTGALDQDSIAIGSNVATTNQSQFRAGYASTEYINYENSNLTLNGTNAQYVLPTYTAATLPTGTTGGMIWVSDGNNGNPTPSIYDGTNWKVVTLGATVSAT